MGIKGKAYLMGAFEHPLRDAPDTSTPQLHAECARGALIDAGLTKDDVDGYFCAGDAPGFGGLSMIDYMGLENVRHLDSTETGGSSYIVHVGHAAQVIADPLHLLDCCVVTDGGGALIVTSPEVAKSLNRPKVRVIGAGEAPKGPRGGLDLDLTHSGAVWSGPRAFEEARVKPADIKYASIYDSFTITVLMQLEDLR